MSLNYVTLTLDLYDGQGNPVVTGSAAFTPSVQLTDTTDHELIVQAPVPAVFHAGGFPQIRLLATDNGNPLPAGWGWVVAFSGVPGSPAGFSFFLPYASGASQYLSAQSPVSSAVTQFAQNPMTTLGDTVYGLAAGNPARVAGNTSSTKEFLTSTGSGSAATAPAWGTIAAGDVPQLADYAPTGLTGATAASRYVGATTSGAPASGTFAVGDFVIDRSGKVLICTAAGTPGTWTQAGSSLDSTAADFQPVGTAAAGSLTAAARGDHVHPYEPWQFYVGAYGAKGDGKVVTDGAMSSSASQTHLTCATSTPFANAAAGMPVHVGGAGGGTYTPLCTTIASVTDSGHVVLNASATSTVASAIVYFGTDDTAAVQAAVNAAAAYAVAHNGYAEVLFDPLMYIIGGAPVVGGSTAGNAQITLPIVSSAAQKLTLVFRGTREQTALNHWLQTTPAVNGTVLACARNDGTNDGTNGPSFVVGGPVASYGGSTFNNVLITVDGVGIMVPYNGKYGGWGFFGCGEAAMISGSVMAAAVPPTSSSVPGMSNQNNISNTFPIGLQMPDVNNNDNCDIIRYSCEGVAIGLLMSEHTWFDSIRLIYNVAGIQCGSWGGQSMPHSCGGNHASIEACGSAVVGLGATSHVHISRIDLEGGVPAYDPSNYLQGEIRYAYNGGPGYGNLTITGATALRIVDLMQVTGPVASPQAPPASGVAWANQYYRDAWVTLHAVAGVIRGVSIGSVAQYAGGPGVGFGASHSFLLPAGQSYTPVYTGTLLHTVTLL